MYWRKFILVELEKIKNTVNLNLTTRIFLLLFKKKIISANSGWQPRRRQGLHKDHDPVPRIGRGRRPGRHGASRGGQKNLGHNQRARSVRSEKQAVRHLRRRPPQGHRRQAFPHVRHDEIPEKSLHKLSGRSCRSLARLFRDFAIFFQC